jgi:hypothetical protein
MSFLPHEQRVIQERQDLETKIVALDQFIGSELFNSLPYTDQTLLHGQYEYMRAYSFILSERINRFEAWGE